MFEAIGEALAGRRTASVSGEGVAEHEEAATERWLDAGMKALGWGDRDWAQGAKATGEEEMLAWRLRRGTTVSCRWIGSRRGMGDESNVSRAVAAVTGRRDRRTRNWTAVLERMAGRQHAD